MGRKGGGLGQVGRELKEQITGGGKGLQKTNHWGFKCTDFFFAQTYSNIYVIVVTQI